MNARIPTPVFAPVYAAYRREGLTQREIAERLRLTLKTVRKKVWRARVAGLLEPYAGDANDFRPRADWLREVSGAQ